MEPQREKFPALNTALYADTAAAGLIPEDLLQWRMEQDMDLMLEGSAKWQAMIGVLDQTRQTIKKFFNAELAEVALVPNFSIGLNMLLEDQPKNQKVLLINKDYPSVNWPFENRGFDISYVPADDRLEEHIEEAVKSKKISVLALSLVQWLDGVKIDVGFLKKLKEDHPELLIIADGTQHSGAFNLDFEQSGIDVLGSSGYKWLLSGYGNGFFLIRKGVESRFFTPTQGFNSANGQLGKRNEVSLCKRLEPGHLDSLNFGSLGFSMQFLAQLGMDHIDERNALLSNYAREQLANLGLLDEAVLKRPDHGSIFRITTNQSVYEHLLNESVRCSWRAGALRLSFHFYNTKEEIDQIVGILKKVI